MVNPNCPKCHGTGIVKEKDGTIHTCWDCLMNGDFDVHSEKVPDSKIKI
jgi:DnaJ-class molecular chaperone